eukprot:3518851-Rhodomonas_salina.1
MPCDVQYSHSVCFCARAMRRPVLTQRRPPCSMSAFSSRTVRTPLSAYALAMLCPVLTSPMRLLDYTCVRACYAMSGTDIGKASAAICLRARYAMPGTDTAYTTTRNERGQPSRLPY